MRLRVILAATAMLVNAPLAGVSPEGWSIEDAWLLTLRIDAEPPAAAAPRDVSGTLASIIDKHKIPAMAAVVVRGDGIVAQGVSGVRKAGGEEKATLDDLWHLGSCTKSMTATMCAILVEQGKLRWDSTLAEALPKLAPEMNEEFKAVTLSQLLTNRGGVPGDLHFDGLWGKLWNFKGPPQEARALLAKSVLSRPPDYKPGTKNVYANASFAIAGHMAEVAAGKPYEELMQEVLFGPLGMTSCGWGAPGTAGKTDQPWGHRKDGTPVEPRANGADNPAAITPAGRLHCTIGDWAKYIAMHLRGDRLDPERSCKLLAAESFDRLHTPPDALSDYCYGWGRPERPWAGPPGERFVLTHNGSNTMWFCVTWIAPKKDFAVLVCCNTGIEEAGKACDEACATLIGEENKLRDKPEGK
jgi:CubicO group peptidase (beta-lactamase class C family)